MKNFYNQDKIKIEPLHKEDYEVHRFELDIPTTYGFKYYKNLDNSIREFFGRTKSTKYPTLFQIVGDFTMLEDADPEEKIYFIQAVLNIFVSHIVLDEAMNREKRLAPPKALDKVSLSIMNKKAIVNNKIMFPQFSVEIIDYLGNEVFKVM